AFRTVTYCTENEETPGSASGAQAIRMASAGAAVTALDLHDHSADFSGAAREAGVAGLCDFVQANVMQFDVVGNLGHQDVIVCQRMIHYLAWDDALQAVLQLRYALAADGRLYVSASGLHSELGQDYGHALYGAEQRYCELANEMAEKHAIGGPVCLYSVADLARLLETAGFRVEQVFASAFGNVKAVARVVEQ
ncbi:bifunctional 2-polyprenyl-6-hydroxyphenol methylase/3-demethylubiquinol 3-O-methyltransferase UbiG, partial [Burkholderia sp. LMG 13014]|uniref:class I SAM-dependent methyltransferase n=1 Tax=Burkholderia sp. LMG 13014 TaxID=2709306 RepID=UPI001965DE13